MIIVPSTAVETMGLGALGGLTAFGKTGTEEGGGETPALPAADAPKTKSAGA